MCGFALNCGRYWTILNNLLVLMSGIGNRLKWIKAQTDFHNLIINGD